MDHVQNEPLFELPVKYSNELLAKTLLALGETISVKKIIIGTVTLLALLVPPVFFIQLSLLPGSTPLLIIYYFIVSILLITRTIPIPFSRNIPASLLKKDLIKYPKPYETTYTFYREYIKLSPNEENILPLKQIETVRQAGTCLYLLYKSQAGGQQILLLPLADAPRTIQSKIYRYFTENGFSLE
ncbi:hypothetical protein HGA91_05510 [candidate division WWE3 bacterium]|nr:hypothetical protein [candidate division WWE3 bacterium]